jgi:hypothetical protein
MNDASGKSWPKKAYHVYRVKNKKGKRICLPELAGKNKEL